MSHKAKSKFSRTKKMWSIIACAFTAIIVLAVIIWIHGPKKTYDNVGSVNGEPISAKLFHSQLTKQRAEVYSYFNKKFGAEDSKDFWTSSYGGEIPADTVKKKALEECVTIIVQQELAKRKGVLQDISYDAFLSDLKKENNRRKKAVEKNQVIYGPVEYSEDDYFSYVFSNMVIDLKTKLEGELEITDKSIRNMYEARKETAFKLQSAKTEIISIPFGSAGSDQAKEKCKEILKRLNNGEKFENLARKYNKEQKVIEQVFDDTTKRGDMRKDPQVRNAALSLKAGQISLPVEGPASMSILKCIEYKDLGYKGYEEVKGALKTLLIEDKYKEFADKNIKAARVAINKEAVESIKIE